MQTVILILGFVLILAVVEQTTGQICSENYCRFPPRSDCGCKGCCLGKLGLQFGRCELRGFPGPSLYSCFCYQFNPGEIAQASPENGGPPGTSKPPV